MKLRPIFLTLICIIGLQTVEADEYTLSMLIDNLERSVHFAKTEAMSQIALNDYKTSTASLYPTINVGIPFTLSKTDEGNYTIGLDNQKNQLLTAAPEVSISKLLPTAGLLTAQISDSVSKSSIIESSLIDFSTDPALTNTASISVNLSQPVFFKGAFTASLEIINKTYENSSLNTLTVKNSIILYAIENFYNLKQAQFNIDLIQIRFLKDKENFKRINHEYEMGLWTKSELFQAKSILIKSEIDLLEANQNMETFRQYLITNYSLPDNFTVSSLVNSITLNKIEVENIVNKVIESNPGVNHAKNLLRMQKASLTILRKESGPVLSIGGSYSYMTDIENLEKYRNTLSFSLGLQGNLFDGGKDSETIKSGKALYKQLEADLSINIIDLKGQIKTLTDSIDRSSKLIELYSFQERASQYEYKKGLKDLELGQITEKELSELQINLENTKLNRQQNIININMLYLQLVNLQGEDLLNYPIVRNNR